MRLTIPRARVLDMDIENRPLSYLGSDYTTSEVTAIACGFVGDDRVYCWLLGEPTISGPLSGEWMLTCFRQFWDQADIVTGHYIRRHDLPIINGALAEHGMTPLGPKLTIDTKLDLIGFSGISKSQESLAETFGVEAPKVHMTQPAWRQANRLTPAGLAKTRERVVGDVRQHKALFAELHARRLMKPARRWAPR